MQIAFPPGLVQALNRFVELSDDIDAQDILNNAENGTENLSEIYERGTDQLAGIGTIHINVLESNIESVSHTIQSAIENYPEDFETEDEFHDMRLQQENMNVYIGAARSLVGCVNLLSHTVIALNGGISENQRIGARLIQYNRNDMTDLSRAAITHQDNSISTFTIAIHPPQDSTMYANGDLQLQHSFSSGAQNANASIPVDRIRRPAENTGVVMRGNQHHVQRGNWHHTPPPMTWSSPNRALLIINTFNSV